MHILYVKSFPRLELVQVRIGQRSMSTRYLKGPYYANSTFSVLFFLVKNLVFGFIHLSYRVS